MQLLRFGCWTGTIALLCTGLLSGQALIANLDDYKTVMKTVAACLRSAEKSLASGEIRSARADVTNAKTLMRAIHTFFVEKGRDDLVTLAQASVDKLAATEKAMDGTNTEARAAAAALKEVASTCQACHGRYRIQDPSTRVYSFKPGTI